MCVYIDVVYTFILDAYFLILKKSKKSIHSSTHPPTIHIPPSPPQKYRLAPNVHIVRGDMDEGPTAGMNAATPYPEHKVGLDISMCVCI